MSTHTINTRVQTTVIDSRAYTVEYSEHVDSRGHHVWRADIDLDGQWIYSLARDTFAEAKDDADFTISVKAARFAK